MPDTISKPPLLVLVGPTAVGKTDLAIKLALKLSGEIVTADSMQVYRGLDIGTAKPTLQERAGIPHHLLDVVDPDEDFNVARYRDLAHEAIRGIHTRGHLPILSGGTGLYVKAVLGEFLFPDLGASQELRDELARFVAIHGPVALHDRLKSVDARTAARLHPNDVRRVTRALELYLRTGVPMSEHRKLVANPSSLYRAVTVGLTRHREQLYKRIDERVIAQLEQGLLQEVAALLSRGYLQAGSVASQALGYKEMVAYLMGDSTLENAVQKLQKASRRYAKRQYTWFRHQLAEVSWFAVDTLSDPVTPISDHITAALQ